MAVPTETVYGLAANALDGTACARIFAVKERPAHDPLIVHVPNLGVAEKLAFWNDAARKLARKYWPGPLTIVLPKRPLVPGIVTSGGDSVALRCPYHPVVRHLLRLTGLPLAAPSANLFGAVSPTTAAHVKDGLGGRIRLVVDGGECSVGLESTIVDLRDPASPAILRPGVIGRLALGRILRRSVGTRTRRRGNAPVAPGMFERHYSPSVPLVLVANGKLLTLATRLRRDEVAVFYRRPRALASLAPKNTAWLTATDAAAAAHSLYRVLRSVDRRDVRRVLVELAPARAGALADAINDRLRRAAGRC